MNHYTYMLKLQETGEYYIGVRSCKCDPEEDPYMGSMKTWKPDKDKLVKFILYKYKTRKEANQSEARFIENHIENPLNRNYHIPGKGFCNYGKMKCEDSLQ